MEEKDCFRERTANFTQKLKELGVKPAFLFGSLARNKLRMAGEIDLVVVQQTKKRFLDRLEEIYQYLQPVIAVDILVYTPKRWMRQAGSYPRISASTVLYLEIPAPDPWPCLFISFPSPSSMWPDTLTNTSYASDLPDAVAKTLSRTHLLNNKSL